MQCVLRRVEKLHSLIWKSERACLSQDTDLYPKHNLFPLKGPLLKDASTFSILLFLINSAPFSLRGLDLGTCACRSLGRGPRLSGFRQGCQQKGNVVTHYYQRKFSVQNFRVTDIQQLFNHNSSNTTHHTPLITHHSSYTTHHTPLIIHH